MKLKITYIIFTLFFLSCTSDETIESINGAIQVILQNSGHSPLIDVPDVLASKIIQFIK